jgi:hypothetical protein
VPVNRGPSFASCSAAIVAAIEADATARQKREAAYRQEREEAFRAAERYPQRVALMTPPKANRRGSRFAGWSCRV